MSKRILIVASDFPPQLGGVATYSWEVADHLQKKGWQVTVLTRTRQHPLPSPFQQIATPLPKRGVACLLPLAVKLRSLLKNQQFDQVLCTLWFPEAAALWLAQRNSKKKLPYWITTHAMEINNSTHNFKNRLRVLLQPLKRRVFFDAHKIFSVSQFTKQLLVEQFPDLQSNIVVINNGVNFEKFPLVTPSEKKKISTLITVCRLMPHKGIDQVLRALPKLITKHPQLQYKIVGSGPDEERLKKLTKQLEIGDHVFFLGRLTQEQLVKEYQSADLFVMLSRQQNHHIEGFGLVFLEAALSGLPSLGGASGGIPDAICDNETGWLVDPIDLLAIEEKLDYILSHPQQVSQIAKQAQQNTLQHRSWDAVVNSMTDHMGHN